ncbi:coatomer subunit delta-3 [Phragmites australis]|uniref:coatomer subunit delta-3 n=1 Tax=Phragmites australis TaxID=29695 RepID=UPI002D76A0EF|nr:coatomer subunit delta-3 [Phragmites australis]XP_062207340.1 coatomer subunit delta-3 [Phragmites australis]XP_062207341.1 coatomer subunit delta-3 [Phragmites australis]XP_062207342.1 coatomer subunit delta-3 [Phragmites australis]
MVVLAASIISKSGKALLSRQFVDMPRTRIEGLLAAFPKLVGTGKQHTYVEAENVRYVYQPIEALYLLVITNKQSNILEDLETLRLLSKLVPEYSPSLDEEGVCRAAYDLILAFDEAISLGNKENVTVEQVKQYCEMESHEEKLHKLVMQSKINETKDLMRRKVTEIEKSKTDRGKTENAFGPLRTPNVVSDMNTRVGGPGDDHIFGDSFTRKPKGRPSAPTTAISKVAGGMKLGKSQKTNQFLESLKAEGELILEDTQPSAIQSRPSSVPPSDPITVTIEEKLNVTVKRDGGINNFDIQGTLALQVLNDTNGFIQLQVENQDVPGFSFKTHPNINKELFNSQQIVGAKDPSRPFPSGQNETPLVKWRIQELDEASLPLAVNCWPSVSGNETYVNIEYEASEMFDLHNVVISMPLPALSEAPSVRQIDGEWKYDSRNSVLEWSIILIDQSNRSGSMEFAVPAADPSTFFPISVGFSASNTFSDLKVTAVLPLREGSPPKFSQRIRLVTANYQVV